MIQIILRKIASPALLLATLVLYSTGCVRGGDESVNLPVDDGRIHVLASQEYSDFPTSRTVIGGQSLDKVFWSELDMIRLFWQEADASGELGGETFDCFRLYPDAALFSSSMADMAEGNYTYYATYPVPESINGTAVTFNLPAKQEGSYDMLDFDIRDQEARASYAGNCDFMLAVPVTGGALTAQSENLSLRFIHQCHVMRVQVPTGRNQWGENVKKLRVEFPTPVVGKMTMDLTNPTATPQLSEGSNAVIAELSKVLSESTEDDPNGSYVWLFLCPTTVDGEVRFTAYDENGRQSSSLSVTMNKALEAGRITPVNLTVPQELPVTWIDFAITGNNLGEEPTSFTVKAPEGALFRNGTDTESFTINPENKYSLGFYDQYDGVENGNIIKDGLCTFTYESEHAVVSEKRGVGSFTPQGRTDVELTVPYLLYEDFSNVGGSGQNNSALELSPYNLPGWSADRFGFQANTAAMVTVYLGSSAIMPGPDEGDNRRGRMDTPFLTSIKDGASVTLQVSFDAGGTKANGTSFGGVAVMYSQFEFGSDTRTGAVAGKGDPIGNTLLSGQEPGTDGSYTYLPKHYDVDVAECTSGHRLAWRTCYRISYAGWSTITGKTANVYIDNIKVSIKK